jgi:hypothetical protein
MYNNKTFFQWLTEEQGMAESTSHSYITHINKAERFARMHNLGAKRLFDIVDYSLVERTIEALMRNEAFYVKYKAQYNSIKTALRKYLSYVSNDTAIFPESIFNARSMKNQDLDRHMTKRNMQSTSGINPKDVVNWLITQPNANGSLYLKNVVQQYMSHLQSAPAKLDIIIPLNKRAVFACRTVAELDDLWKAFKLAPNYTVVNRGTGASLSAGLNAFRKYLSHIEGRSESGMSTENSIPYKDSQTYWSNGNSEGLDYFFTQLHDRLQLKEKEHRTAYGIASDNNDWDAVDRESEIALRISKWRKELENLQIEIKESGFFEKDVDTSANITISEDEDEIQDSEELSSDIKIGRHIREKLRELSQSGFVFSPEQMKNLTDEEWGKSTFSYYYNLPFAKILTDINNISSHIRDMNGQNRYWSEVFTFGQHKLLFFSQWFEKDRDNFNNWYYNLINEQVVTAQEDNEWDSVFIEESESDIIHTNQQSLFDYKVQEFDTSTSPSGFTLLGKQYTVSNWSELYYKVCEILVLHHPYVMANLATDILLNTAEQVSFSYIESEIKHISKALDNGMWIEAEKETEEILRICSYLLNKCGLSHNDFHINTGEDNI